MPSFTFKTFCMAVGSLLLRRGDYPISTRNHNGHWRSHNGQMPGAWIQHHRNIYRQHFTSKRHHRSTVSRPVYDWVLPPPSPSEGLEIEKRKDGETRPTPINRVRDLQIWLRMTRYTLKWLKEIKLIKKNKSVTADRWTDGQSGV